MPNEYRIPQNINEPGTLKVGSANASDIAEIIHGSVAIDIPSVAADGAISSASAAVTGLTADHRVFPIAKAWAADEEVIIAAAVGIAGGIQVTAANPATAAINPTSQTFNFLAIK